MVQAEPLWKSVAKHDILLVRVLYPRYRGTPVTPQPCNLARDTPEAPSTRAQGLPVLGLQVHRQSKPPQISKPRGLHIPWEMCHRPLQWQNKTMSGGTDSRNLLECCPPQRHGQDSRTDPNTVEASNQPLWIDYLKYGPMGFVNPFRDVEIISL
jgi:hypothetical protein